MINQSNRITPFGVTSTILFFIYCYFAISFVWHDNLSSFASDSANYMLMALFLSPWQQSSVAIQEAWQYQSFPPFFPFILAISGAAHNMVAAHVLSLLFLITSLPLIYLFSKNNNLSKWQALTITFTFAISPSSWMNMLGILSENLYILISFATLIFFNCLKKESTKVCILFGLLLSALILTRTIGLAMLAAYILVGFNLYRSKQLNFTNYITPICTTVITYLLTKFLFLPSIPSQYIEQLHLLTFSNQFYALIDAWFSSWQYYWSDTLLLPYLIILILGIFACLGLFLRAYDLKLDAIYILFYILIILLWPHPGQALRFIYPIQALLIVYAFYFIQFIFHKNVNITSRKPILLLMLLTLTVVMPSLSYTFNRYKTGEESGYNRIKEFYRIPDLKKASINASIQLQMFNDMKHIQNATEKDDVILFFEATYVALLSNRLSKNITFTQKDNDFYMDRVPEANYIYLSRIHPRKTKNEINGLDIAEFIEENTEVLWATSSKENNEKVSEFYKIVK